MATMHTAESNRARAPLWRDITSGPRALRHLSVKRGPIDRGVNSRKLDKERWRARWESTPCQGWRLARAVREDTRVQKSSAISSHTQKMVSFCCLFIRALLADLEPVTWHFLVTGLSTFRLHPSPEVGTDPMQRHHQLRRKEHPLRLGGVLQPTAIIGALASTLLNCNFSFADMLESGRLLNNILFCSVRKLSTFGISA
jgi:hypothetical protein